MKETARMPVVVREMKRRLPRLPTLRLPTLRLPALRMPTLRLSTPRLPTLRLLKWLPLLLLPGMAQTASAADPTLTLHEVSGGKVSLNFDWSTYEFSWPDMNSAGDTIVPAQKHSNHSSAIVQLRESGTAWSTDEFANVLPAGASISGRSLQFFYDRDTMMASTTRAYITDGQSLRFEDLKPGTTYDARVRLYATDVASRAHWSPEASFTTPSLSPPGRPANLRANSANSGELALSWSAPSNGATTYHYRWSNDGNAGTWENAAGAAGDGIPNSASATSHTLTGLSPGVQYTVQIRATNSTGAGAWSQSALGTPIGPPAAPTEVTADAVDEGLVVRWTAPADTGGLAAAELGYQVQWRLSSAGSFSTAHLADTPAGASEYSLTGLTNGSTYVAQVRAKSDGGESAWSADASGTPSDFDLTMLDGVEGVDPADGILVARYLAGVRGAALIAGLNLEAGVAATAAANIAANLDALDVDGVNGTTAADGIMIARYMLGVKSGAGLYAGQTDADKAPTVIMNIESLVPAP